MKLYGFSYSLALALILTACNGGNFSGKTGPANKGNSEDAGGMYEPKKEPLDISILTHNENDRKNGGPVPGEKLGPNGEPVKQTFQLTCDNSQGAVIKVGANPEDIKPPVETMPTDKDSMDGIEKIFLGSGEDILTKEPPKKELPEAPPVKTEPDMKIAATVKGEFCPKANDALTIFFIVDYSGSMGEHHPEENLSQTLPGNDPQTNGSCGRLRAAEAIMNKVEQAKKVGDKINVGLVPFAGNVLKSRIIPIIPIDEFEKHVNKDVFCQTVVQDEMEFGLDPATTGAPAGIPLDNPGGISGRMNGEMVNSSTNYQAAFQVSEALLMPVYGRKVVYFISDGQPTSPGMPGNDHVAAKQAGSQAGAHFREVIDNLTLNALLLGDVPGAIEVLADVAGSKDRVRTAANADELADKILEFPEGSIDESTGRATLTIAPYRPEENLGLQHLKKDTSRDAVWVYETQPFFLLGKKGESTRNIVKVTAKGQDGSTHMATVEILYQP